MNKILTIAVTLLFISCAQNSDELNQLKADKEYVESNVEMYVSVWESTFSEKNIDLLTSENFHEDVTVVTASGNVTGLNDFKAYYANYINGFSDGEFSVVNAFAQGDNLVKQWSFKGTHDGDFFGIPATNKSLDLKGTTIVKMKDGKVLQEEDFFDNYSFMKQLGLIE
jgi:steroid delta-isomerase-like uncharacterized protein|tara:strand:- start:6088 stop:6591 length:504 start_codon:yes stop_codon:yes gene_type:complete